MIGLPLLSSVSWVMLSCLPQENWATDTNLVKNPIVVSYLFDGQRVREIVILKEDGSRSEARWRGKIVDGSVELVEKDKISTSTWKFEEPKGLSDKVVLERHYFSTLLSSERAYECNALIAERTGA